MKVSNFKFNKTRSNLFNDLVNEYDRDIRFMAYINICQEIQEVTYGIRYILSDLIRESKIDHESI